MYMSALEKLRKELNEAPEAVIASPTALVSPRQQEQEKAPESSLDFSRKWLQMIQHSGRSFREKSQMSAQEAAQNAQKRKPSFIERPTAERKVVATPPPKGEEKKRASIFDVDFDSYSGPGSDQGGGGYRDFGNATDFVSLIDATEGAGRYDTLFGHSQRSGPFAGTDITTMTLGDLKKFASPSGAYGQWVKGQVGRVSTPMGRYQFVGSTLFDVARQMGLPDTTVFNKETQDKIFKFHLANTLKRGDTIAEKVDNLRDQWEGFKSVPTSNLISAIKKVV